MKVPFSELLADSTGSTAVKCRSQEIDFGFCSIKNFVLLDNAELEEILSWRNHQSIRRWMFNHEPIAWTDHVRFVGDLAHDDHNFYWRVALSDTGLGVMYLKNMEENRESAELGIYINPFFSGGGAGKKIMEAIVRLGFEYFKLRFLKLNVFEDNLRAIRFYSEAGFEALAGETVRRNADTNQKNVIMMRKANISNHDG